MGLLARCGRHRRPVQAQAGTGRHMAASDPFSFLVDCNTHVAALETFGFGHTCMRHHEVAWPIMVVSSGGMRRPCRSVWRLTEMGMRRCVWRRCPRLVKANERYCDEHKRAYERERGSATARGYGVEHRRERARWERAIRERGAIPCTRCGRPITSDDAWDLGHSDDRTTWTGPEHAHCNRKAGQRNSARMRERWNR